MTRYLLIALLLIGGGVSADMTGTAPGGTGFPQSLESTMRGSQYTQSADGTLDSVGVYLSITTEAHNVHAALYKAVDSSFVDSTEIVSCGTGNGYHYLSFVAGADVYEDTVYVVIAQAEAGNGACDIPINIGGTNVTWYASGAWYKWVDPFWTHTTGANRYDIHFHYTPDAAPATGPPDQRHGPDGLGQRHGPDGSSARHRP